MIDKLTPEQEAQFPTYVDKWVKIGTTTKQTSLKETKKIVRDFRELIELNPDVPLLVLNNPIECWVACCLHEHGVPFDDIQIEMEGVFDGNPKKWVIPKAVLPFNEISLVSTFGFYDYMQNVVGVEFEPDLKRKYQVWESTSKLWAIYPLDNLTVVCRHPKEVHLNENKVLHRDGGPALVFDGLGDFKCYALNGVSVPEYLAITPSHQLDLNEYKKEKNADVKAEFIRKAGIERFVEMGTLLDTYTNYDQEENTWWWKSEYELYDMKALFPNLESAPFLKMKNFTTQVWHMEGVSPNCRTIEAATKERFGGRSMRIVNAA